MRIRNQSNETGVLQVEDDAPVQFKCRIALYCLPFEHLGSQILFKESFKINFSQNLDINCRVGDLCTLRRLPSGFKPVILTVKITKNKAMTCS